MSAAVDDLLRDLADELAVEPSASMTAQVRARVHRPPARLPLTRGWPVVVALLTSGYLVTYSVSDQKEPRGLSPVTSPNSRLSVHAGPHVRDAAADPAFRALQLAQLKNAGRQSGKPRMAVSHPAEPQTAESRTAGAPGSPTSLMPPMPLMIVPADQALALRRILDAMRTGPAPVPPAVAVVVDAEGRLPAPRAIEIPEITIEQLLPPGTGGGNRDRQ